MKKYEKFAILIVLICGHIGLAGRGVAWAKSKTYYKTIAELGHEMGDRAYDTRVRVAGDVADGSIQRNGHESKSSFSCRKNAKAER